MLFFVVAFAHEAKAVIKHYNLTRIEPSPFALYGNGNVALIVSGMGASSALIATTHLLTRFNATQDDTLINLGICAATENFSLGQTLIAHTISDNASQKNIYPDLRFSHPFHEVHLYTANQPQDQPLPKAEAVDMEAFFVLQAARIFLPTSKLFIAKVVSDHFDTAVPDKTKVHTWMSALLEDILPIINAMQTEKSQAIHYTQTLQTELDKLSTALQLTQTQSHLLLSHLNYYILRHHKEPLLPKYIQQTHKKEQKDAFNKLLTLLAS